MTHITMLCFHIDFSLNSPCCSLYACLIMIIKLEDYNDHMLRSIDDNCKKLNNVLDTDKIHSFII